MRIKLPEEETGYQLDQGYSFWSVVVPEATENLVVNPSFENGLTGVTLPTFGTAVQSFEKAARGAASIKITPTGSATSTVRQTYYHMGAGAYTFSADIWHVQGQQFSLLLDSYFHSFTAEYTGWGRYSVTWYDVTAGAGSARNVSVVGGASNTQVFYTDGWQVEHKAYATTYCDGDLIDDSFNADPYAYGWEGFPHESRSYRAVTAYNGGKLVSLWEIAQFKTTAIVGLGLQTPNLTLLTLADGQELQTGFTQPGREFSIVGRVYGSDSIELESRRQNLINTLTVLTRRCGQLVLRYQPVNTRGKPFGKTLSIVAAYQGGLDGNMTNLYQSAVELKFKATRPALREEFGNVVELWTDGTIGINRTTLRTNNQLIERDPNTGEWTNYPGSGATTGTVTCGVYLADGSLVVGGTFTVIAGVSARRLAKYDYKTRVWSELGGGVNLPVSALSMGKGLAAGLLFVGGGFTTDGSGSVVLNHVAYLHLDTNTWDDMALGVNNVVYTLCATETGAVYVGGTFTADGTASPMPSIGLYSVLDDEWNAISTSTDAGVFTIIEGPDRNIYVGGGFTVINGASSVNHVAKYITSTGIWDRLGDGLNSVVYTLAFSPDKTLYAGGIFSGSGLIGFTGLGRWTGYVWEGVADHAYVYSMAFDKRGQLYASTSAAPAGSYTSTWETIFQHLNGSVWVPFLQATTVGGAGVIVVGLDGRLLVCYSSALSMHFPGYTAVEYSGTAEVQPSIYINSGGTQGILYGISNWTTGDHIYFKSFSNWRTIKLTFSIAGLQVTTETGGANDIILYEASDINTFRLVPGTNHITLFISASVPDSLYAFLYYNNNHSSIDIASKP